MKTMDEQLKEWLKEHPECTPKNPKPCQKKNKRRTERLSESDIKSLMGMNMPRYKRNKGALRQK